MYYSQIALSDLSIGQRPCILVVRGSDYLFTLVDIPAFTSGKPYAKESQQFGSLPHRNDT